MQEAFVRAWVAFGRGRFVWQDKSVAAYLVKIAGRLLADHFKSGRYRLEVAVDDCGRWDHSTVDGPEVVVERAGTVAAVRAAVGRLRPAQRVVVELRYLDGRSASEVAAALGVEEGAVKARAYRAWNTLRGELAS